LQLYAWHGIIHPLAKTATVFTLKSLNPRTYPIYLYPIWPLLVKSELGKRPSFAVFSPELTLRSHSGRIAGAA